MKKFEEDSEFISLYEIEPATYTAGIKNPRCNTKPISNLRTMECNNAVVKPTLKGISNAPYNINPVIALNK
tara:strand:+ start:215 stop:427 length:213 start_codon:yes stop_codon:yes gene_type:complete